MNKGILPIQRQEEKEHGMVQGPKEGGIRSGEGSGIVKGTLYQAKESALYDSKRPSKSFRYGSNMIRFILGGSLPEG